MLTKSSTPFRDLLHTPLTRPDNAGAYWKGVKHGDLVLSLISKLTSIGYKTGPTADSFRAWVSADGADTVFSMRLHSDGNGIGHGVWPVLAVEASNARRKVLRAFAGGVDRVTDCPIIVSDFVGGRYTQTFELADETTNIVDWWSSMIQSTVPETVRRFRATKLSNSVADAMMFAAGRQGVLPWTSLREADKLWRKREDRTAWGMLEVFHRCGYSQPLHNQIGLKLSLFKLITDSVTPFMKA